MKNPKEKEVNEMQEGKLKETKLQEDLAKLYEQSFRELKEGDIVKGKVVATTANEVLIDVGYKSEGVIPLAEFSEPKSIKIGDEVDVLVESKEDEGGMVVLSKSKADRRRGWESIINNHKEGDSIEGKVLKRVKGGMTADIGMPAFLPASLCGLKGIPDLNGMLGQKLNFVIVKINKLRRNVVISRKDAILKELGEKKEKMLQEIKVGDVVKGTVKNITDFGAFIDLGGLDGLLHITDMSWGRVSHPSEIVALGNEIEVVILNIDKVNKRVSLGLKQKTPDPWQDVPTKYPLGSKVKGRVVNIVPYGAFIELEKGVEGLVHISEFSWTKRINHPSEMLAIGDVAETVVLSIDPASKKISLGIKQTEANPWENINARYPVGSKAKGKVRNLVDYGAFVELEHGIDGLIHVSDMSWTKHINHPQDILRKGEKIETVVLSVDAENRKIALGLKQLTPDPWSEIVEKYTPGTQFKGTITRITNFGLFVEIEKDLEGMVHVSELDKLPDKNLTDSYKAGQKIEVKIIKVDSEEKKIVLSMRKAPE